MVLWPWIAYALMVVGVVIAITWIGTSFKDTLTIETFPEGPLPTVSTVVPARNEERNIDRCARGIARQDYPHLEMIFVDHDSKDATPDILARHQANEPRIRVVHTGGRPDGWNGKQWACHSGAKATKGEWLLFMDADTYAEPDLISRTLAFCLKNKVDMLTLQPWYEMGGLWERIVMPTGLPLLLLAYPPNRVNDPNVSLSMANGQFILIRREAYEAVDGHEGIKDRMMDDYAMGEVVKGAGFRMMIVDGADVMRVRLYTNLQEIWAGALKAAVQISGGWAVSALGLVVTMAIVVFPPFALSLAVMIENWPAVAIMSAVVLIQIVFYSAVRITGFRAPPWTSLTYPFGGIIIAAILLDGMIRLATGQDIKWKGRSMLGRPELPAPKLTNK